MPFANTELPKYTANFEKIQYFKFDPGSHIIRILEDTADIINIHYVLGKYTLTCLDEDCPICANNKKIIFENPENFRDVKGYYPRTRRYVFNVLDRTPVKICSACQTEVKKIGTTFPATCPQCSNFIGNETAHPLNKVRLISTGVTLASQLNGIDNAVVNAEGNPIGLRNYDISLSIEGAGKNRKITPVPAVLNNDVVEVPEETFFDTKSAVIKLTSSEILDLLKGISLKDIFSARKASGNSKVEEALIAELNQDIHEKINSILK